MSATGHGVGYWNHRYDGGGYEGEPPIPFVDEIAETVKAELGADAQGLYVGCGDGRNFIPLINKDLHITGIDSSGQAIAKLRKKRPDLRQHTQIMSFEEYFSPQSLDFIAAIQVFQHGNEQVTTEYFAHSRRILRAGGLLFVRVNATSTDIVEDHEKYLENESGSFSVRYSGRRARKGQIRFYTERDLARLAEEHGFDVVSGFREETMPREDGTAWTQWESTWRAI